MHTCTWAPTVFHGPAMIGANSPADAPTGSALTGLVRGYVERLERLGISHLLIAQRWWGSGQEMEGSSLDCFAMTAWIAAVSTRLNLVTAVHPGFTQPAVVAKWGATLDQLTQGRWAINLTSGWNLREFSMYGVPPLSHDERYDRTAEFAQILRQAWQHEEVTFSGRYFQVAGLRLEPRPTGPLTVFQGGQSDAALALAARHSDWMFLNGGAPERIADIISRARAAAATEGRTLRFALYAAPLCRTTDAEAWDEIDTRLARIDPVLAARRQESVGGAQGMWSGSDPLSPLDTNEGYASRLIGSPDTVFARIQAFRDMGVDMLHLDLRDPLFVDAVLPAVIQL